MARKTKKTRKSRGGVSLFGKKRPTRRSSSIRRSDAVKKLQRKFREKRAAKIVKTRKERVAKIVKTRNERKSKCLIDYNRCMGYSSNRSS